MFSLVSARNGQPIAYVTPAQYVRLSCASLTGVLARMVYVEPRAWMDDEEVGS